MDTSLIPLNILDWYDNNTSSEDEEQESDVEWEEGSEYFINNGINIASSIRVSSQYDHNLENVFCFPNPSSGDFNLEFYLNSDDKIHVSIFNTIGKKVHTLQPAYFNKGVNNILFSLPDLRQGLYYIEVFSDTEREIITIDLTK